MNEEDSWKFVGDLPLAMRDHVGVSLNNDIFMTGTLKLHTYV